jgi:abortive infection bacteriophage resistance protein
MYAHPTGLFYIRRKMPKPTYSKSHFSIDKQIIQLQSRGMLFNDESLAKHYLSHINYYRLTAYWLPYEKDHETHAFKESTSFEEVLKYYTFDRSLRLLLLSAIEKIEVSIRTQMAYTLTAKYGAHAHLKQYVFNSSKYEKNILNLRREHERSDEVFISHFTDNYKEILPPLWASVELMSLGMISHWFSSIDKKEDRQNISRKYKLDEKLLRSYLHHVTIVRNICAHHGRVWNKRVKVASLLARKPQILAKSFNSDNMKTHNIYNTLVYMSYFLSIIEPSNNWNNNLKNLLDSNDIDVHAMGFPENWKNLDIWSDNEF